MTDDARNKTYTEKKKMKGKGRSKVWGDKRQRHETMKGTKEKKRRKGKNRKEEETNGERERNGKERKEGRGERGRKLRKRTER